MAAVITTVMGVVTVAVITTVMGVIMVGVTALLLLRMMTKDGNSATIYCTITCSPYHKQHDTLDSALSFVPSSSVCPI